MRTRIKIGGIVQGVGFRPFVYRLATALGLSGWVGNTPAGVVIEVEGEDRLVSRFIDRISTEKPPAARIDWIERFSLPPHSATPDTKNAQKFEIRPSDLSGPRTVLVSPDLDACPACLAELHDPHDRRHRYPFITCTDCGPRYTIVEGLPYDREQTVMREFALCARCQAEYDDPVSRRFHAEAICCPDCGPRLWLADSAGAPVAGDPLALAIAALKDEKIVAIKGIGGFHLAVDATNPDAVSLLRERKKRPDKPLAVMVANLEAAGLFAEINAEREIWLNDQRKPIVLLPKKTPFPLAEKVAPANRFIGVMLAYAPLHHLLLADGGFLALVMTSANLSGEPIVTDNLEAMEKLSGIADLFLLHDRRITTRLDDSVLRIDHGRTIYLRRARSFAPIPLTLADDCGQTIALGASVKSTICLTRGREAFVSQHLGDLDLLAGEENFVSVAAGMAHLLEIKPDLAAHDQHPDYFSSRHAQSLGLPTNAVQHHHAHAASCLAEHGLAGPALAITLDGAGLGEDGAIWGGELLLADLAGFERLAHLRQVPMPGGEAATREPWRMAASHLWDAFGDGFAALDLGCLRRQAALLPGIRQMLAHKINAPLTSSCGRLFDAVAALAGLRDKTSFEGQQAMALEMCFPDMPEPDSIPAARPYQYEIVEESKTGRFELDTRPLIREIAADCLAGKSAGEVSHRFHHTLAAMFATVCGILGKQTGIEQVALSGGVFQNAVLTELLVRELKKIGLIPLLHQQLPPNDGCIAFGQAVVARARQRAEE